MTYELSGDIYQCTERNKAIDSYIEAINYVPIPDCIYKANDLLIQSRNLKNYLDITGKGIENSPYDSILILYKAYALIQLRQRRNAFNILNEHRKALRSFIGVRKIVIVRNVISLIMIFMLFGKQPNSKIIGEMIKRLKKKSGFNILSLESR